MIAVLSLYLMKYSEKYIFQEKSRNSLEIPLKIYFLKNSLQRSKSPQFKEISLKVRTQLTKKRGERLPNISVSRITNAREVVNPMFCSHVAFETQVWGIFFWFYMPRSKRMVTPLPVLISSWISASSHSTINASTSSFDQSIGPSEYFSITIAILIFLLSIQ